MVWVEKKGETLHVLFEGQVMIEPANLRLHV